MMQVDIENVFNNVFQVVIFKKLQDVRGPLATIVSFTMLFYGAHSFFIIINMGSMKEGVTIIESTLGTK